MMKLMRVSINWVKDNSMIMGVTVLMASMVMLFVFAIVKDDASTVVSAHEAIVVNKVKGDNKVQLKYNPILKQQRLSTRKGDNIIIVEIEGEEYPIDVMQSTYGNIEVGEKYNVNKKEYFGKNGNLINVKVVIDR